MNSEDEGWLAPPTQLGGACPHCGNRHTQLRKAFPRYYADRGGQAQP